MGTRQEAEEAASRFIAQRETGPWTESDGRALESWMAESASHRAAYYCINAAWKEAGRLKALGAVSHSPSEGVDTEEGASRSVSRSWLAPLSLAAGLLALGIGLWVQFLGARTSEYQTSVGGLATLPMSDGSRVTLNTDSQLRVSIDERERRMVLERGEAYFQVAKDPSRPFIVAAGDRTIVAIGTEFSVRREGEEVRVSVTEGAVRMGEADGDSVELRARSVATSRPGAVKVEQANESQLEQRLAWRSGSLTFRDTPLAQAVAEFNRYNSRKMVIEDPSIAAIQVGGVFRATNLDPFIHLIEEGFAVDVREEGDRILLRSR